MLAATTAINNAAMSGANPPIRPGATSELSIHHSSTIHRHESHMHAEGHWASGDLLNCKSIWLSFLDGSHLCVIAY